MRSNEEVEGVTTRWGVKRAGVDRWHYPNGSVRNRGRDILQSREAVNEHEAPPTNESASVISEPQGSRPPFSVHGVTQHADGPALKATTFYGEQFEVWASSQAAQDPEQDVSTSAGESCLGDSEEGWTSSSSSSEVGFHKNGIWQPRARTASEHRAHVGGRRP